MKTIRPIPSAFTDPRFLGYNMSAGFNVSTDGRRTANDDRPYELTRLRRRICGLAYRLPRTLKASVFYQASPMRNLTNSGATAWYPNGTTAHLNDSVTASPIRRSTTRLDPSDGLYVKFTQDFAGVGGDVAFVRVGCRRALLSGTPLRYRHCRPWFACTAATLPVLARTYASGTTSSRAAKPSVAFASYGYGARDNGACPVCAGFWDLRCRYAAWRQELCRRDRRASVPAAVHAIRFRAEGRGVR